MNYKVFISLTVLIVLNVFSNCTRYEDIKIEQVNSISFKGFEDNKLKFNISLPVDNPNNYNVSVTEINLKVFYNNKPLGYIETSEKIIFIKNTSQVYVIPCIIRITNVLGSFSLISKSQSEIIKQLTFEGYIKAKKGILTKKIEISKEESKLYIGI